MSKQELQELSRRAAMHLSEIPLADGLDICTPTGNPSGHWYGVWLHESTEACAEIMVRVMWDEEIDIIGGTLFNGKSSAWAEMSRDEFVPEMSFDDPMLAFRVAVLRALVALKEKP